MAKIRVYELAKELDVTSKDIVAFLSESNIEGKSAQSGLEDNEADLVKNKFGAKAANKAEAKSEAKTESKSVAKSEAKADAKPAAKSEAKPKAKKAPSEKEASKKPAANKSGKDTGANSDAPKPKKKKISAVFNSQYSKNAPAGAKKRQVKDGSDNRRPRRRNDEERTPKAPAGRIQVRPVSERTVRPSHIIEEEKARKEAKERELAAKREASAKAEAAKNAEASDNKKSKQTASADAGVKNRGARADRPERSERADRQERQGGRKEGGKFQDKREKRDNKKFEASADAPKQNASRNDRDQRGKGKKFNRDNDRFGGSKKQERTINLEKSAPKKKQKSNQNKMPSTDEIRTIVIPEKLTIKDLADEMKMTPSVLIKQLFLKGVMATVNQEIDFEQAEEIALEYNVICELKEKVDVIAELLKEDEEDDAKLKPRPPVVCVMGHVDHGKTSLLDAIRDTKVTNREAGGITQHIGAYMASINDQKITFLDTPGHEAFTAMRMRGANSTDIAILVVAADDGVMPQTVEAINHAKAADIEIVVAINKIDKPNANIERVKQELSEYELIPEDWGGSTIFVPVSAHTGEGIDTLMEMILLTAEVLELKANPNRNARGLVVEAKLDKGRGVVSTVLVQKGTLHVGDHISAGASNGKVRAMVDENGKNLKVAGPSTPVEILGLSDVPNAGEIFISHDSDKEAKTFAQTFISEGKNKLVEETKAKMSLDDLFDQIQSGNMKELHLIVKADVQGSVEAVKQSLEKLTNEEVAVKVIHGGVGAINESDVILASASNAIIIGFNVRPDAQAKTVADTEGVDIRLYKVIYSAIEDVEAAMKGLLDPVYEEQIIGHAQVRQIFKASDIGNIAGSYILDGRFERGCKVRVFRGEDMLFEGDLASLKRFKDDVKEVKAGYECGLVVEGFGDFQEEDTIESYIMVEVKR